MDFLDFLAKGGSDFKGRTLKLIWSFSDDDIQKTHDFIQIIFPLNKASESVFHGYYLNSEDLVEQIRNSPIATENILQSSKWYLSFLKRNIWLWNRNYDHNQKRITRVIECLRLLVSKEESDKFYDNVMEILKDNNKVNHKTLNFWENA